jgi:hypothetical protein
VKISKGLTQAYQLQDFTFQAVQALKETLVQNGKLVVTRDDAQAIGQLVRAWEIAQERVRIHRGKPLPGSKRPPVELAKRKPQRYLPPFTEEP